MFVVGLMSLALLCNVVAAISAYKVHKNNLRLRELWTEYDTNMMSAIKELEKAAFNTMSMVAWLEAGIKEDF